MAREGKIPNNAYAVIMAGGSGERLWPLSTPDRPKQFVDIFDGKPLIRHAVDRLAGMIPPERILVITAARFLPLTRRALPMLPRANIIGEPCRRDTAAAVALGVGLVKKLGGEGAVGCILTADQLMTPVAQFQRSLSDAIRLAAQSDAVVTLGLVPTYPATGYGYIECGAPVKTPAGVKIPFSKVARFVEKPDLATAKRYLKAGRFRWNSGMFIWRADVMAAAFRTAAPDIAILIDRVAAARRLAPVLANVYPTLRAISVDFAVMEKAPNILVGESSFDWDDVGGWTSLAAHFPQDGANNTVVGTACVLDTTSSIVVNMPGAKAPLHRVGVLGLSDVVVVNTPEGTLVCSRAAAPRIRELVKAMSGK